MTRALSIVCAVYFALAIIEAGVPGWNGFMAAKAESASRVLSLPATGLA
jgi:hypothetical protein